MKKQYFGDENDYRKYGLLRCITEATGLTIGVIWMLTEDDGRKDGEFRHYLQDREPWSHHDRALHAALSRLLEKGVARDVRHAERWGILPDASWFDGHFPDTRADRGRVFEAAMAAVAGSSLVFLDPDNGIEVKSKPYGRKGSRKYVYWTELEALFERGHSLLVYQHYPRKERRAFEASLAARVKTRLGASEVVVFSTARVAFVLALQEAHAPMLPRIEALVAERWGDQIYRRAKPRR